MKNNLRTFVALLILSLLIVTSSIVQAGPSVVSKPAGQYGILVGKLEHQGYDLVGEVSITKNPDNAILVLTITPSNPSNPNLTATTQQWISPRGATILRKTYTNYTPILDSFDAYGAHEIRGPKYGQVVYTHTTHYK